MSDLLISFGQTAKSELWNKTIEGLVYLPHIKKEVCAMGLFGICVTHADNTNLWDIYRDDETKSIVCLAGRITADEFSTGNSPAGIKRFIFNLYKKYGLAAFEKINGEFAVAVFDGLKNKLFVARDRCGAVPFYSSISTNGDLLIGTQPNMLSILGGTSESIDYGSIAQFILTGKVWPPHTFYTSVTNLDHGCIFEIDVSVVKPRIGEKRQFFIPKFDALCMNEKELIQELGQTFKNSVRRRTLGILGQAAVSLSGGLDSRILLSLAKENTDVKAYTFFNEKNIEFKTAKKIADSLNVPFYEFQRDKDFYGNNARMGVHISGGMGDFANNHYVGFVNKLLELNLTNNLAGYYCDYMFKGLVADRVENRILRQYKLGGFNYFPYTPTFNFNSPYFQEAFDRLNLLFPKELVDDQSDQGQLTKENRRIFPFSYEPDNQETVVSQKIIGWYLPIADNDVVSVYCRMPLKFKVNGTLYAKMVDAFCDRRLKGIPYANSGVNITANAVHLALAYNYRAAKRKIKNLFRPSMSTDGSWNDWSYYFRTNATMNELWYRDSDRVKDLFKKVLNCNPYDLSIDDYCKLGRCKLLIRLLNIKLWFEDNVDI
jgi:asparagine synthetase B (glutamine-hydrolysing)